jgi:hypothetical protein
MKKRLIAFRIPSNLDDLAQKEAEKKGITKTDIFIDTLSKRYNNWIKRLFK